MSKMGAHHHCHTTGAAGGILEIGRWQGSADQRHSVYLVLDSGRVARIVDGAEVIGDM